MKLPLSLDIFIVCLLLCTSYTKGALNLRFGETDFSHREDRGSLEAVFEARGQFTGSIVVEVIPMTVSQFLSQGLTPVPPAITNVNLHHAKAGDDFNDTVLTFTLDGQSSLVEKTAYINIIDDALSEYEEIFVLVLKVVNATEGIEIVLTRNVSVARIRQDRDNSNTILGFSINSLDVSEGDGLLNNTLYIEVEGVAEPTLHINISTDGGYDIRLLQTAFSIPSGVSRVPVPLEIIDDDVVEDFEKYLRIDMSSDQQSSLFSMGDASSIIVIVKDNDRPHFGFKVDPPPTDKAAPLKLLEGETAKICVLMVDKKEFKTDIEIAIELSPESAESFLELEGFPERPHFFSGTGNQLTLCFNVTAKEDDIISGATSASFRLIPKPFIDQADAERVDTDVLQFVIVDNDGLPQPPRDVNLELINSGKDLLITWKASPTDTQPISQFRVTVETANIDKSSNGGRSKRQTDDNNPSTVKEHTTTDTRLVLENVEGDKTYAIEVCAENRAGQACAPPKEVTIKLQDGKLPVLQITGGLEPGSTKPKDNIIVIVLVPLLLILAVCLLIVCLVVCSCCCCCSKSKTYYPSEQERRIESKHKEAMDERYHGTFTSMESITSTTSSASDFTQRPV